MNAKIQLTEVHGAPDMNGLTSYLEINNLTEDTIQFPGDCNVKIFMKQNNNWVKLQSIDHNYPQENQILKPQKGSKYGVFCFASPFIQDMREPTWVRFVVIGNITKNGNVTNDQVGAYLDVTVNPLNSDESYP